MYECILFTGKTGQCSDIALDEREAERSGLVGECYVHIQRSRNFGRPQRLVWEELGGFAWEALA